MEKRVLTQHEKDIYNMSGHVFAISGSLCIHDMENVEFFLKEARELAQKLTNEIDNKPI